MKITQEVQPHDYTPLVARLNERSVFDLTVVESLSRREFEYRLHKVNSGKFLFRILSLNGNEVIGPNIAIMPNWDAPQPPDQLPSQDARLVRGHNVLVAHDRFQADEGSYSLGVLKDLAVIRDFTPHGLRGADRIPSDSL